MRKNQRTLTFNEINYTEKCFGLRVKKILLNVQRSLMFHQYLITHLRKCSLEFATYRAETLQTYSSLLYEY